jgi:hypothetical protein
VPTISRVAAAVLALATDPRAARAKAATAQAFVRRRQAETMKVVAEQLRRATAGGDNSSCNLAFD